MLGAGKGFELLHLTTAPYTSHHSRQDRYHLAGIADVVAIILCIFICTNSMKIEAAALGFSLGAVAVTTKSGLIPGLALLPESR